MNVNKIKIRYAATAHEARELVEAGFCPIECSFGEVSVVDDLQMDHHGSMSGLEPVSIRAYRDDYFAARVEDPRFVVTGNPGADDVFAILALSGLLPHPRRTIAHPGQKKLQRDLTELAQLIARLDRDPIGVDKTEGEWGKLLIVWGAMTGGPNGVNRTIASVYLMHQMLEGRPLHLYMDAAEADEKSRRQKAQDTEFTMYGESVKFVTDSPVWGYDVWYARKGDHTDPNLPEGWEAPVVVAYVPAQERVSIGSANKAVAEAIFGEGGLKNLFSQLGEGWGGSEAMGGSPRGEKLSIEQATEIANRVQQIIGTDEEAETEEVES